MDLEMDALKGRLKTTWTTGDYGLVARGLEESAADFLARFPIARGTRLLDIACGTGQVSFPAAARGARVTGVDISPTQIEQARVRASQAGVDIMFEEGDAEALAHEAGAFDFVVTLIGAMFAPRPDLVVRELLRVCRPGGRIVMGNWIPSGFIGRMFKTVGSYVPPPAGMPSPLLWGDPNVVRERFGDSVSRLRLKERVHTFRYPVPPAEVVDHYAEYFGPIQLALAALDETGQTALRRDLVELWSSGNTATDGTTYVEAELLEVDAVRQ